MGPTRGAWSTKLIAGLAGISTTGVFLRRIITTTTTTAIMRIRTALTLTIIAVTESRFFKYDCVTGSAMTVVVGSEAAGLVEMLIADGKHIDPDES